MVLSLYTVYFCVYSGMTVPRLSILDYHPLISAKKLEPWAPRIGLIGLKLVQNEVTPCRVCEPRGRETPGKAGSRGRRPQKNGQFRPEECFKIALVIGCFNQKICINPMGWCVHTLSIKSSTLCSVQYALSNSVRTKLVASWAGVCVGERVPINSHTDTDTDTDTDTEHRVCTCWYQASSMYILQLCLQSHLQLHSHYYEWYETVNYEWYETVNYESIWFIMNDMKL